MIDCTLLMFKEQYYILPTLAISQAVILPDNMILHRTTGIVGYYDLLNQERPIVTLDAMPLNDIQLRHPKIAFLNSMQPNSKVSYFAVLFTGQAKRLRVTLENIVWADEDLQLAVITEKKSQLDVVLVNLTDLSTFVIQSIASSAKVAK